MYGQVNNDCQPCSNAPTTGLEYIGGGRGDFAMEPQMKYVGYGGDYSVRRAAGFPCLLCLAPLLLALLSLLAWIFWPFDECKKGIENHQIEWSRDKINRCCARGFIPCPPLQLGSPVQQGPQGPVDPYNCALGDLNWEAGWSTEKKQWCCNEHGKGCGHDEAAVANMYDCNAGTENWVKGWSENKKQWCCAHGYKGCPQDAALVDGQGYGAGSHGGMTPYGAPVAGQPAGFVPYSATQR